MSTDTDERLMRYLDGESDAAEAREVEVWLEGSAEARSLLSDLESVGDAVRSVASERGARAGNIAELVMARLEAHPVPRNVVALPGAGDRPGPSTARHGARRWLGLAPAFGLAVAAAAAVVVYVRTPVPTRIMRPVPPAMLETKIAEPAESAEPSSPVAEPEPGASIESVDFGAHNGTIFMVPSGPEATASETPVVWLLDDAAPSGRRMKPL